MASHDQQSPAIIKTMVKVMLTAIIKTMAMVAIMIMGAILNADGRNQEEED